MTPALAARVDAWISDNIALLEPESGFREAMAFNLRWGWIEARGTWMGLVATGQTEAECLVAAAAMRGILLELVRWAWRCDEWRRLTVEPAGEGWCLVLRNARHRPPSRAHGWNLDAVVHRLYAIAHSGPFGRNEFVDEDEALVTALEAAPRPGEST